MRSRTPSLIAVIVAASAWAPAALAQAPPPCTNADKIGCSYSAVYGWVAGNVAPQDVVRDPKAASDAAAQAERDRQAYDKMVSDMAAQQRARDASNAQAAGLMTGGTEGETGSQRFRRFHAACIQSSWRMGCGAAAAILYEHPEYFCEMEWERDRYSRCTPERELAMRFANNGCISGDGYACDVERRIREAAGAPTLAPSDYGKAAPAPAPTPAPAPSVAVAPAKYCGLESNSDDLPLKETSTTRWRKAYGKFAEARRACHEKHTAKDCLTAATMTLEDPKFDCQAWRDVNIRSCPHPIDAAYYFAELGCGEHAESKEATKSCALLEKLKVQAKQVLQAKGC